MTRVNLGPTTPQIFRSKRLSVMIWSVSKFSQNQKIYMFFVIFVHKMTSNVQKTCKFTHFDSPLRRSISFPIIFLIEIFEEWLGRGLNSLNLKCVPITPFIEFWYMSLQELGPILFLSLKHFYTFKFWKLIFLFWAFYHTFDIKWLGFT